MDKNIVKRQIYEQVEAHLKEEEITVLIGPRQVGKTTLILQMKEELITKQNVPFDTVFYFNLDVVSDRTIFQNQTDFINFIKNRLSGKAKLYIFIDEVQRIKEPGLFFKGVYDLKLPVKLILTGSSSLEIKVKTIEPLTGRKRLFRMFPLNFSEYISFREEVLTPYIFFTMNDKFSQDKLLEHLANFILFGGYPKVVTEEELIKKIGHIEELYTSYIEKDVVGFLRIKDSFAFTKLVKILAQEIGDLFNTKNTSQELQIKNQTVKNYVSILENTFIAQRLLPFFHSARAEIRKMPKVYFYDTGMRNFAKDFRDFPLQAFKARDDAGKLLENFVFSELLKQGMSDSNFWRTKDGAEVDFVVHRKGEIIPIEVKMAKLEEQKISRGFHAFLRKYNPRFAVIINWQNQSVKKVNKTEVHFLLPYQLPSFLESL